MTQIPSKCQYNSVSSLKIKNYSSYRDVLCKIKPNFPYKTPLNGELQRKNKEAVSKECATCPACSGFCTNRSKHLGIKGADGADIIKFEKKFMESLIVLLIQCDLVLTNWKSAAVELTSEQKQAELKRIKQKIEDKEKEISTLKQQASLLEGSPKSGEPCQPDCQSDCNVKKIQSPPKSVESCQPDCLSDCNINKGQNYSADSCVSDCQGKCNDQTSAGKADPCSLDCQGECNESPQPPLIPNQPRPSPKQQRVSPKMSSTHRTGARPVSQAKAQHVPTPRQAPAPPPRVLPQRQLDPYVNYYDENMCLPECYSSCSRHQGDPGQYDYGYGYNQGYTQVKGRPQPQMQQSMYNPLEDVYAECDPNCPKIAMDKWYSGASRF